MWDFGFGGLGCFLLLALLVIYLVLFLAVALGVVGVTFWFEFATVLGCLLWAVTFELCDWLVLVLNVFLDVVL